GCKATLETCQSTWQCLAKGLQRWLSAYTTAPISGTDREPTAWMRGCSAGGMASCCSDQCAVGRRKVNFRGSAGFGRRWRSSPGFAGDVEHAVAWARDAHQAPVETHQQALPNQSGR
ncbi:unnamed protein product, partial [Effrenium voratum]